MPPDLLRTIGESLYGAYWIKPLADALQVNARTVQRWAIGQYAPSPHAAPGLLADMRKLLVARGRDLARVVAMVDKTLP